MRDAALIGQAFARRRPRIGANAWDDPSADPAWLASQAELIRLTFNQKGLKIFLNPNLPPHALLENALLFPELIEQNPVLEMLELEDPILFAALCRKLNEGWVSVRLPRLSGQDYQRLQLAFARHVLPLYEDLYGDNAARQLLNDGLRFLQGAGDGDAIEKAAKAANKRAVTVLEEMRTTKPNRYIAAFWALAAAAQAACLACGSRALPEDVWHSAQKAAQGADGKIEGMAQEEAWQAAQVRTAYWAEVNHNKRLLRLGQMSVKAAENARAAVEREQRRIATKAEIQQAVQQAKAAALACDAILHSPAASAWPSWLTLGILAAGAVVALTVGPEALAAAGVSTVADVILDAAAASEVTTVSVSEVAEGEELAQLIAKLKAGGVAVTKAAAEVLSK